MKNRFYFNLRRCFFYFGIFILFLSFSKIFSGCGGSQDDDLAERERKRDSISVYTKIDRAFLLYKRALTYNETFEDENAKNTFEFALKELGEINPSLLNAAGNYVWKRDYEELAKSIVQDFLTTQKEILESSLVFVFADRIDIEYERVQQVESKEDIEPLPQGSDVKLIRNSAVDGYIDFFSKTDRGRAFIDKTLYRSGKYFPLLRKILKFHNAPEELIYLSVQESGLAPTIVSRAGAVGMWQFMPATGYAYGLFQDSYRDDRRDFEKATDAAARHLKDLYRSLGDWYLAFAAYNAGPGRVNTAIKKSGSRDFWTLRGFLPGETKNYVPSILALSFVFRNPEAYGFKNVEYSKPIAFDRVSIKASLTLEQVASLAGTDIETIRDLNSELTTDLIPVYDVPYQLRIPHNSFDTFAENYRKSNFIDKTYMREPVFAGNEIAGFQETISAIEYKISDYQPEDVRTIGSTSGKKKVIHTFKEKELLSGIAMHYRVRPTDIRIWNNLPFGTNPKPKQQLSVYISAAGDDYGINEEINKTENVQLTTNTTPVTTTNTTKENTGEKSFNKDGTRKYKRVDDNNTNTQKEYPSLSTDKNNDTKKEVSKTPTENPSTNNSSTNNTSTNNTSTNNTSSTTIKNEYDNKELTYNESTYTDNTKTTPPKTVTPEVTKNETVKTETVTKKTETKTGTGMMTYTVKQGDFLSAIATEFKVKISEIKEWNGLDEDKIMIGQKLKIYSDPSLFKNTTSKVTVTTHTVSSGEHLTAIATKYGISVSDLREWNNISDDKILIGQTLTIKGGKNVNTNTSSGTKKTYTVKSGDMLTFIARDNGVSINNLMKWNDLQDDKIIVGQELKLYDPKGEVKTTGTQNKNTKTTPPQKQRKRKN